MIHKVFDLRHLEENNFGFLNIPKIKAMIFDFEFQFVV